MARRRDDDLAETRRREILDAAARCFVRRGVHQTSMREIIADAGLSAGAIYNYFEGKETIIEAIAARERREIEEFADYLATEPDPRTAGTEVRQDRRDQVQHRTLQIGAGRQGIAGEGIGAGVFHQASSFLRAASRSASGRRL